MKRILFGFVLLCQLPLSLLAQLKSGPMLGHVDFRTATLWVEHTQRFGTATVKCWPKNGDKKKATPAIAHENSLAKDLFAFTETYTFTNLEPGTEYSYEMEVLNAKGAKTQTITGTFKTQELWQYRKSAPDFTFLTGSCSYFNEPKYDRPGTPYGNDSAIFETMAKTPASFMLWLGDNWYTREVDYYSDWGLYYRASLTRSLPILQNFWKSMPHYAIWDDHDYGWNDADKTYPLKQTSRKVFMDFWTNPSYGENGEGIYSKITKNDLDIFMLDDRWFRSADATADSINGQPNADKLMWGKKQMEWLKNSLLVSNGNTMISFRIIATGSQVLNPVSPFDCAAHFPAELDELKKFIKDNKITGVLFFDGDRHHSEVIEVKQDGMYPLYDVTSSPLTSGSHKFGGPEKDNKYRVMGLDNVQNFSKVSISGARNNRVLKVEFMNVKGEKLNEWSVNQKLLKF
jgi:alkaline phosphatase D